MIGATLNYSDGTTKDIQLSAEVIAGITTIRFSDGSSLEVDEIGFNGELFFAAHGDAA